MVVLGGRRPRILHILSQRPGRSGSGVFLQAMVREAGRRGYQQHVIAAGPPGTTAAEVPGIGLGDFSLVPFPSASAPFPVPGNSDVMPYPSTVFSEMTEGQVDQYLNVSREVMDGVRRRFRPDIVHAHHLWLMTGLAREVFADTPLVATSHNAELRQMAVAPWLGARVVGGIRAVDRVCVLTPRSVQDTVAAYGVDRRRIVVTGAGFDQEVFGPPAHDRDARADRLLAEHGVRLPPGPVVTFVGRLSTAKGVPSLLEAATEVRRELVPDLSLVLVGATGSGDDGAVVGAMAAAAGDWVVHLGPQPPAVVAGVLQCADLFVLPSMWEGLPLTMLEAAACGCPGIVTGLPTIASWAPSDWLERGLLTLVPLPATSSAGIAVAADLPGFVSRLAAAITSRLTRPRVAPQPSARTSPVWPSPIRGPPCSTATRPCTRT